MLLLCSLLSVFQFNFQSVFCSLFCVTDYNCLCAVSSHHSVFASHFCFLFCFSSLILAFWFLSLVSSFCLFSQWSFVSFSLSFSSHFITCEKDTCLTDVALGGFLFVCAHLATHIICAVCCDVFLFLHLCVQYVCQPAVERSRLHHNFLTSLTQDVDSGVRAEY